MFHSQIACSSYGASFSGNAGVLGAEPGLIGRRLLALAAATAFVLSVAALSQHGAPVQTAAAPKVVVVHASSATALRDRAEAMRAEMLSHPGVVAVHMDGLQQQALRVEYSEARLRALGLSGADLASALPVDAAHSQPGMLALRTDDMQGAADTQLAAGGRHVRLGDVAHVVRAKLDAPIAAVSATGEPEARLTIVSAR